MPEQVLCNENQPAEKPFPWRCPKCRQLTVSRVTIPYRCQRTHNASIVTVEVPNLAVPRCSNCGEVVFDYAADDQIRAAFRTQFGPGESGKFPVREGPIMSDTRAELFAALQALAGIVSDMRGGQLMAAVGELCADLHGRGLCDADDAELLEAVWQFRRSFEAAVSEDRQESESLASLDPARREKSGTS